MCPPRVACPEDTYGATPGLETCTACTANAGTDGATGEVAVGACLCNAGYEGELATAEDTCGECPLGTWLAEVGPGPCTPCTANAITAAAASVAITDCLCNVGHSGTIAEPEDVCAACELAEYKDATGPGDCTPCPALSTTEEEASTVRPHTARL